MLDSAINIYGFMLGYCRDLVEGFTDADLLRPAAAGANPPVWILAHLAVIQDFALHQLGQPPEAPAAWAAQFGPGSTSAKAAQPYPTTTELLGVLDRGSKRLIDAARRVTPEQLAKPHGIPMFQGSPIRTVGDALVLSMTGHLGLHTGQLSLWRRLQGRPPLF